MTITLELTEQQARGLSRRALREGHDSIGKYLLSLAEWTPLPDEEWEDNLKKLHEITKHVPARPDSAFSRETMYRD